VQKTKPKILAYLRVSTDKQDLNNQRLAILSYAHKNKFKVKDFIEVQTSSRNSFKERMIDTLLEQLTPDDTLIVSELSRLGRSLGQVIKIVDELVKNHVQLIAIKENIVLNGKQTLQNKVMITLFGLFAEVERDLISERTKQGLNSARAKGKLLGRPKGTIGKSKLDGKEEEIKKLLGLKVSQTSIAKIMEVSRPAMLNFIKTRKLVIY